MKRFVGVLVLGMLIGVGGGCKKSTKEKLIGKWQRSSDGVVAEILPDGTVTVSGKDRYQYEILGDGRLKSWPLKDPSRGGVEISTIAFIADTLVLKNDQLLVKPDQTDIDSTYVRTLDPISFEAGRVTKWVRVR